MAYSLKHEKTVFEIQTWDICTPPPPPPLQGGLIHTFPCMQTLRFQVDVLLSPCVQAFQRV